MTYWKLVSAYFIPALILIALLGGHFLSQFGWLEKWFLGDNEIRQVVSPAFAPKRSDNPAFAKDTAIAVQASAIESSADSEQTANDNAAVAWTARTYDDSIKTARRTAQAYFNLALDHKKSGRLQQAIEACQQALLHQHNFPEAWLNLGALHYRREDWQKAREAFGAATLLDSSCAKAHFNLALVHGKLGEWDKAELSARQALARDRGNAAVYNLLGLIHTRHGDYPAAISVYKEGLAVNAKDPALISNLSLAFQKMARSNRAEENL